MTYAYRPLWFLYELVIQDARPSGPAVASPSVDPPSPATSPQPPPLPEPTLPPHLPPA